MKNQRTVSFVQRINGRIQWKRFRHFVLSDLGLGAAVIAAWSLAVESQYGPLHLLQPRWLHFSRGESFFALLRSCSYTFSPKASEAVFSVAVGDVLFFLLIAIPCLWLVQMLRWSTDWSRNASFLRRTLRPLSDMAKEAQRIAAGGINEQQLHSMEQAIDSITDSESSVHIEDAELAGVETALKNLLRRLRESYAQQIRFVDDASHELRTPIAVIQGYSSMLERWGKDDPETLEESVRAIAEESQHMQTLVDQLLFLARGDGGRHQLALAPTDTAELMREIAEECRMIDGEHEYVLREGCSAVVSADRAMLKQAIRILSDNAAKYTSAGGRITFSVEEQGSGFVGLSVSDQGVGLSPEEAEHIFERFYRGSAVRGSTRGSGLGLSIAAWIAEQHRGSIEAVGYSDIGTRVTIRLPAAPAE